MWMPMAGDWKTLCTLISEKRRFVIRLPASTAGLITQIFRLVWGGRRTRVDFADFFRADFGFGFLGGQ